jgi:DNA-binding NtrC family response regulator
MDRDGISLLAELQRLQPDLGLVAMTDRPTLESAVEALRNGACDYLFKPVTPQKVWAAWERVARRKQIRALPAAASASPALAEQPAGNGPSATVTVPLQGDYKEVERTLVRQVIVRFDGNKTAAAKALGMHRKTLYRVLDRQNETS